MTVYQTITERTPVQKGWSGEQKFRAVTAEGQVYLLRISPFDKLERKQREFAQMVRFAQLPIPMCLPIEFGTCEDGVYSIHSWIDGDDTEDRIMTMDEAAQYR
jgi:aminoglycoside phosphotransferase (APT) family kinase protein